MMFTMTEIGFLDRAKASWEQILTIYSAGAMLPRGSSHMTDATVDELGHVVVSVATALDFMAEGGELEQEQVRQLLLYLLVLYDGFVPITPDLPITAQDLQAVIDRVRTEITGR
jgi:hypothetical protein